MKSVTVLCEGAWASAVANLLADNGYKVHLWCYEKEIQKEIADKRTNSKYLPGIKFSENIFPTTDLKEAVNFSDFIFEAAPVKYLRSIIEKLKDQAGDIVENKTFCILSKGIENETLFVPSEIIKQIFPNAQIAVVSGPSFAKEVAQKSLTGFTISCTDDKIYKAIYKLIKIDYTIVEQNNDIITMQLFGALKNVIALAIGILEGLNSPENTKALTVILGIKEILQVAHAYGSIHPSTLKLSRALATSGDEKIEYPSEINFAALGDLVMCALMTKSRNKNLGIEIAKNHSLKDILQEVSYIPEGPNTAISVYNIAQKYNLKLPICTAIYEILYNNKKPASLLEALK